MIIQKGDGCVIYYNFLFCDYFNGRCGISSVAESLGKTFKIFLVGIKTLSIVGDFACWNINTGSVKNLKYVQYQAIWNRSKLTYSLDVLTLKFLQNLYVKQKYTKP